MKKIVAASWHSGGANAIAPVIKRLIEEKKTKVVVIGYQFSEKIFQDKGIEYKTIDDYGLRDVSSDSMNKLLQKELPDLVLTGTSSQDDKNRDVIEQTLTLAAKMMDIKSLAVLDFWASYSLRFNDIFTGEIFKFLPDKIAIMDGVAEEEMLAEGFAREKLAITGNPHFDDLPAKARNFSDDEKQAIREKIGPSVDLLFFFAGNVFSSEKNNLGYWDLNGIDLVNKVLVEFPEKKIGVAVKLHPRMPASDLAEISQYLKNYAEGRIRLVTDIDTQQLVLASDLTLTAYSTIGIEAVYMRKPCISLQPGLKGKDLLIVSKKRFIPVGYGDIECAKELTRAIISDEYREKELPKKSAGFTTDGKATERVVELVYKILAV